MADVWQFSESSLPLLKRCIEVAKQPGTEWLEFFKPNSSTDATTNENRALSDVSTVKIEYDVTKNENRALSDVSTVRIEHEVRNSTAEDQLKDNSKTADDATIEHIRANLEVEENKIDYLIAQCGCYDNVLPVLAGKLTSACIETIFSELCAKNSDYVETLYANFFPVYFKQDSSSNTLELLITAHKSNVEAFKTLFVALLSEDMPSKSLEAFCATIDNAYRYQLLQTLSDKELSAEAFIQHLNTISSLYKSGPKTMEIQNFMLNSLLASAKLGSNDRNYGRFLLAFFQSLKELDTKMNKMKLEELVLSHKTVFARNCKIILSSY